MIGPHSMILTLVLKIIITRHIINVYSQTLSHVLDIILQQEAALAWIIVSLVLIIFLFLHEAGLMKLDDTFMRNNEPAVEVSCCYAVIQNNRLLSVDKFLYFLH